MSEELEKEYDIIKKSKEIEIKIRELLKSESNDNLLFTIFTGGASSWKVLATFDATVYIPKT